MTALLVCTGFLLLAMLAALVIGGAAGVGERQVPRDPRDGPLAEYDRRDAYERLQSELQDEGRI